MKHIKYIILLLVYLTTIGCVREFLSERPDLSQIVPTSVSDYQALLDNRAIMQESSLILAIAGADEYIYTPGEWSAVTDIVYRNAYIWGDDVFAGQESLDWSYAYRKILYCNTVLKGVSELKGLDTEEEVRLCEGQALFHRSMAFFQLLQLFAKPYDPHTAKTDLGIPLLTSPEIDQIYHRSSVQDCYDVIINDLLNAVELLSEKEQYRSRPTKSAAKALLCKVYLEMWDFEKAYASSKELMMVHQLIDYNLIPPNSATPFPFYPHENIEVLYNGIVRFGPATMFTLAPDLMRLYSSSDLRSNLFLGYLEASSCFFGSYSGAATTPFGGLAIDEIHLIAAESAYFLNKKNESKAILTAFLTHRFKTGEIPSLEELSDGELFDFIVDERRRQLIFRGTRWSDIRRYNRMGVTDLYIERNLLAESYYLNPNGLKTVWPLPPSVLELGNLVQNPR